MSVDNVQIKLTFDNFMSKGGSAFEISPNIRSGYMSTHILQGVGSGLFALSMAQHQPTYKSCYNAMNRTDAFAPLTQTFSEYPSLITPGETALSLGLVLPYGTHSPSNSERKLPSTLSRTNSRPTSSHKLLLLLFILFN